MAKLCGTCIMWLYASRYIRAAEADKCLPGLHYFQRSWRGLHQHIYYPEGHRSRSPFCTSRVNPISPPMWFYTVVIRYVLTWLVTVCFGLYCLTARGIWTIFRSRVTCVQSMTCAAPGQGNGKQGHQLLIPLTITNDLLLFFMPSISLLIGTYKL